jgi:hypothetical protein
MDLEMLSEGLCVKDLVPNLALLGGGRNLNKWGLVEGLSSLETCSLIFSFSLSSSLSLSHLSTFAFSCASIMRYCFVGCRKQWAQLIIHWNFQNCEPTQKERKRQVHRTNIVLPAFSSAMPCLCSKGITPPNGLQAFQEWVQCFGAS